LRLQALCDGLLDASILTVYEGRWRTPDKHEPKWLEHQAGKVERALSMLEAAPPPLPSAGELAHVGQIALACALGYRDLRFAGGWRKDHPRLVGWLDDFAARVPAFAATTIKG
jgi:glutathione S-transferase